MVGVFSTNLPPQFVSADGPALARSTALALLHVLIGHAWLAWSIRIVVMVGAFLRRPGTRSWLDRIAGVVPIALGLRPAIERR